MNRKLKSVDSIWKIKKYIIFSFICINIVAYRNIFSICTWVRKHTCIPLLYHLKGLKRNGASVAASILRA